MKLNKEMKSALFNTTIEEFIEIFKKHLREEEISKLKKIEVDKGRETVIHILRDILGGIHQLKICILENEKIKIQKRIDKHDKKMNQIIQQMYNN